MNVNTIWFLGLFVIFYFLCLISPFHWRKWLLLIINTCFLLWINSLVSALFIFTSLFNFYITKISKDKNNLYLAILVNGAFLVAFKYILPNITFTSLPESILPVGISLFVFQQISYLIDFYRDPTKLDKINLIDFINYSFFFIPFSTGPLTRVKLLQEESETHFALTKANFIRGGLIIYIGLFKKLVIADNISLLTASFFSPERSTTPVIPFLLSKYEVYANFSGFTDVAIGMALMLGFHLPENFNSPLSVRSIVDFWKRWHMSLSRWIRDYIFYPLSVSRFNWLGSYGILCVTFFIFSIWHGAKLTYIFYGFSQVLLIFLAHKTQFFWKKIHQKQDSKFLGPLLKLLEWCYFYVIVLSIPGILFRSDSLGDFSSIIISVLESNFALLPGYLQQYKFVLGNIFAGILIYELFKKYIGLEKLTRYFEGLTYTKRILFLYLFLAMIFIFHSRTTSSKFIYSIF